MNIKSLEKQFYEKAYDLGLPYWTLHVGKSSITLDRNLTIENIDESWNLLRDSLIRYNKGIDVLFIIIMKPNPNATRERGYKLLFQPTVKSGKKKMKKFKQRIKALETIVFGIKNRQKNNRTKTNFFKNKLK